MELQEIEILLDKYLAGETSLKEEVRLKEFFKNHPNVPEHLKEYQALFSFFESEQEKTYEGGLYLPKPKPFKRWISIGVAAVFIGTLLIWSPFDNNLPESNSNQQLKIQNTKGLLMMMGNTVKEGRANLNYLEELDTLQAIGKTQISKTKR